MGKTRDLFKKIRDTKGTCHAQMGSIKDRNGMDLTEAEDIKKGCKNTQNCTKKTFMTQITTITHLEPDIMESSTQWFLSLLLTQHIRQAM